MKIYKFYYLAILFIFSYCSEKEGLLQNDNIKLYYSENINQEVAQNLFLALDSVNSSKSIKEFNCNEFLIEKNKSKYELHFLEKDKDTAKHYLTLKYQELMVELSDNVLENKPVDIFLQKGNNPYKKFNFVDSLILSYISIYEDGLKLYTNNPITISEGNTILQNMSSIYGYIVSARDSSVVNLKFEKEKLIIDIPYNSDIELEDEDRKFFHHTANIISDSLVHGLGVQFRLIDSLGVVRDSVENNNVVYVKQ